MRHFLVAITRDPLSLLGAAIATAAALVFVSLFAIELVAGHGGGPYVGIIAYLVIPAIFAFGLLLLPLGVLRYRRRAARGEASGAVFPVIDLNLPRTRAIALAFVALTALNLVIVASATYKGVEVMDSNEFCGATCHTVMKPEYTAYARSPHARVKCVSCHIGPGAGWYAKSKVSGAWQVVSVALDLYPRPIPTPVHDLRPARETCEQCHWPTNFVGDRLFVRRHYDTDEPNTELTTAMLLRVGGREGVRSTGIHWHVDPGVSIRYRSDPTRETIHDVELTRPDGSVTVFRPPGEAAETVGIEHEWRTMDCVDCHNRPTHVYRSADEEVDAALRERRIDRSLPFVRREGARVLQADYDSHDAARTGIAAAFERYYEENHPALVAERRDAILAAGEELGRLYSYNVFPEMRVTWGTYPDHIGHESSPGCFRCHNDEHVSDDGQVISQDCSTCHEILAMSEEDPDVLGALGL